MIVAPEQPLDAVALAAQAMRIERDVLVSCRSALGANGPQPPLDVTRDTDKVVARAQDGKMISRHSKRPRYWSRVHPQAGK